MSFETISIARQLPVINGMVILPNVLPQPNTGVAPTAANVSSNFNYAGGIPVAAFLAQADAATAEGTIIQGQVNAGSGTPGGSDIVPVAAASVVFLPGSGRTGRNGRSYGQQEYIEVVDNVMSNNFNIGGVDAVIESAKTAFGTTAATDAVGPPPTNYDLGR